MVSTGEVIDNILKKSKLRDDDFGKMLSLIFKIYYVDIEERVVQDKNNNSKAKKPNLREFQIVDFNIEDLIEISDDFSNIDKKSYNKKKAYLSQLLSCLWEIGLRDLFLSEETEDVFYRNGNHSGYDIEERLVEIYYDVLDNNIKDNYTINDIEKIKDPEYQNFIKKYLPLESKGQITINHIPLYELIQ